MPDRREALSNISSALQNAAAALQVLTVPDEEHLPFSMRPLLDAIDRIDLAAGAHLDSRPSA